MTPPFSSPPINTLFFQWTKPPMGGPSSSPRRTYEGLHLASRSGARLRRPAPTPLFCATCCSLTSARCSFGSGTLAVRHLLNLAFSRRCRLGRLRRPTPSSTGRTFGFLRRSRFFGCSWGPVVRHLARSTPSPFLPIRTSRIRFGLKRRGVLFGPPSATLHFFRVVMVSRTLPLQNQRIKSSRRCVREN